MIIRDNLLTEQRLPASITLDTMSIQDAVALMNHEDANAVNAVAAERDNITKAIELVVAAFRQNGRLLYFGAGTSGRLGVLDASECPPTFRSEAETVQGIIAGGDAAMFRAQEGAEDSAAAGAAGVDAQNVGPHDVVMGIAAGGTTPFVHGALRQAAKRGAKTIFLSCVQAVPNESPVDVVIRPLTGPEVLTGSTRLKAGTATKLVLNTITTIAMVQMGKCYENLMVDLRATNEKLRDRGARIVAELTGLTKGAAVNLLIKAEGHVKTAVVMHRLDLDLQQSIARLEACNGSLRAALNSSSNQKSS